MKTNMDIMVGSPVYYRPTAKLGSPKLHNQCGHVLAIRGLYATVRWDLGASAADGSTTDVLLSDLGAI